MTRKQTPSEEVRALKKEIQSLRSQLLHRKTAVSEGEWRTFTDLKRQLKTANMKVDYAYAYLKRINAPKEVSETLDRLLTEDFKWPHRHYLRSLKQDADAARASFLKCEAEFEAAYARSLAEAKLVSAECRTAHKRGHRHNLVETVIEVNGKAQAVEVRTYGVEQPAPDSSNPSPASEGT